MDLVSKHEALAIPNMYLRTEIEMSATELNLLVIPALTLTVKG